MHSSFYCSTAEAEYIALSQAAQEAVWSRQLAKDLQNESSVPTIMYEDNQAAISMSEDPQAHGKSKSSTTISESKSARKRLK